MKDVLKRKALGMVMIACLGIGLTSCSPQGNERPKRKTLPVGNGKILTSNNFGDDAFAPGGNALGIGQEVDIPGDFAIVSLPDAKRDEEVAAMVNTFKPAAVAYLSDIAKRYNGVAVDLSSHKMKQNMAWYSLNQKDGFVIPVMLIWDKMSAGRLRGLDAISTGIPDVKLNYVSGDRLSGETEFLPLNEF